MNEDYILESAVSQRRKGQCEKGKGKPKAVHPVPHLVGGF
jgi:hypothetical protein